MSEENVLANQQTIIKNQEHILHNQEVIVANQASIISNQTQIVDNQVILNVIASTQAHMLNAIRKIGGEKESMKATNEFLATLRTKAEKAVKSKKLTPPQKL